MPNRFEACITEDRGHNHLPAVCVLLPVFYFSYNYIMYGGDVGKIVVCFDI